MQKTNTIEHIRTPDGIIREPSKAELSLPVGFIDTALRTYGQREIVAGGEITNLLLDLRLILTNQPKLETTSPSPEIVAA